MTPDYRSLRNKDNRYEQDRGSMQTVGYSGMGLNFQIQDLCVTEGMGPIMDRTKEHLTAMDLPMIAARKVLTNAIKNLSVGREPVNVERDPACNRLQLVACEDLVPDPVPWRDHIQTKLSANNFQREKMP
jgi:phthalate 4,5-dioxygenase